MTKESTAVLHSSHSPVVERLHVISAAGSTITVTVSVMTHRYLPRDWYTVFGFFS